MSVQSFTQWTTNLLGNTFKALESIKSSPFLYPKAAEVVNSIVEIQLLRDPVKYGHLRAFSKSLLTTSFIYPFAILLDLKKKWFFPVTFNTVQFKEILLIRDDQKFALNHIREKSLSFPSLKEMNKFIELYPVKFLIDLQNAKDMVEIEMSRIGKAMAMRSEKSTPGFDQLEQKHQALEKNQAQLEDKIESHRYLIDNDLMNEFDENWLQHIYNERQKNFENGKQSSNDSYCALAMKPSSFIDTITSWSWDILNYSSVLSKLISYKFIDAASFAAKAHSIPVIGRVIGGVLQNTKLDAICDLTLFLGYSGHFLKTLETWSELNSRIPQQREAAENYLGEEEYDYQVKSARLHLWSAFGCAAAAVARLAPKYFDNPVFETTRYKIITGYAAIAATTGYILLNIFGPEAPKLKPKAPKLKIELS